MTQLQEVELAGCVVNTTNCCEDNSWQCQWAVWLTVWNSAGSSVELVTANPLISVAQEMNQDASVPSATAVRNPQTGDLFPMYIRNITWEAKYIRSVIRL
jgi:hypothetical protein